MAAYNSLNRVQLIGNLGRDPEILRFDRGVMAKFSVATEERWKDKNTEEWKSKTEWHNVTVWNEYLIKVVEKHLRKGSNVYIEGALETRKWQDKQGNDRYSTEVVLKYGATLFVRDPILDNEERGNRAQRTTSQPSQPSQPMTRQDIDDEIPF